jgi:hypothetical protein
VTEIFAAELRADAERLRHLVDFLLHLEITEGIAIRRTLRRQRIEIACGRQLHRLHAELGRGAANHDREVIGRARRGAESQNLFLQKCQQAVFCQNRRRRLEQKALVGAAAALGHEHELVSVITLGIDLALRRHVVGGVLLLIHRQWRHLRVAQVAAQVRVARAFGQRGLVVAVGDNVAALLAHDDRRPGVLTHRQHTAGGDIGVLQEIEGHELVIVARLLVIEDGAQLLQVPRPQIVVDIAECSLRQRPQRLARHHQHVLAQDLLDPHALRGDLLVRRGVRSERKQRRVLVGRNGLLVGKGGGGVHGRDLGLGPEAPPVGSAGD